MAKLKTQQEKLLTMEITRKAMEYLLGLNEKNEPVVKKKVKKYARKMVKLYTAAIKEQHQKLKKSKKKKDQKALPWIEPVMESDVTDISMNYTEVVSIAS